MVASVLDPVAESSTPSGLPSLHETPVMEALLLSPGLHRLREEVECAARLCEPVLLFGEHGTGREAMARSLHEAWRAWYRPQGEFGIWRGPEEGLPHSRPDDDGHAGTLYVPEVDRLTSAGQQTLLAWLRYANPAVGSGEMRGWRLIASAANDLVALTAAGRFDAALLHQVDVLRIHVPPLRERPGDAWLWAQRWLADFSRRTGLRRSLGPAARRAIETCAWPGNLPQLKACLLRAAVGSTDTCIASMPCAQTACLTRAIVVDRGDAAKPAKTRAMPASAEPALPQTPSRPAKQGALVDREVLIEALQRSGWVQAQAARRLGLTIRQVNYAVLRYGIQVERL